MPKCDVVIVGGGIIGCAAASELTKRGLSVTLLERAEIAAGASGRNHGLIFHPQDPLLLDLYRRSREMYFDLARASDIDIGLDHQHRGMIVAVANDEEWPIAEEEVGAYMAAGVNVDKLSREELLLEEPELSPSHEGGFLVHDAYRLDPAALTLALAMEARAKGADIRTHTDVKQILVKQDRVTGVATDDGIFEAAVVIDAAGPWAPKLARTVGVDLPIRGARGWLLLTRGIDEIARHIIESPGWRPVAGDPGPAHTTLGEYSRGEVTSGSVVGLLIQQNSSGHVLLGGSRLTSMRDEPEGVEVTYEIARRAVAKLPRLEQVPISAIWSGIRPITEDGLPMIGPMKSIEGLFIAGGHAGQGVILGGGTGQLIAEMITGADTFTNSTPFDPNRASTTRGPD
jgi:glycine/D-amino acid oxidase-like deaminating enzyme